MEVSPIQEERNHMAEGTVSPPRAVSIPGAAWIFWATMSYPQGRNDGAELKVPWIIIIVTHPSNLFWK